MTLTVQERVILLDILPAEGDILSLRLIRKLREALSFSEEEHKALKFEKTNEVIRWESNSDPRKNVEIGPKAHEIIARALRLLSEQQKLRDEHIELYERFNPEE